MKKEDLEQIVELLDSADEFKPFVELAIEKGAVFLSLLEEPIEKLRKFLVQSRIDSIKQLEEAGFTRTEAIYISSDEKVKLQKAIERTGNKR